MKKSRLIISTVCFLFFYHNSFSTPNGNCGASDSKRHHLSIVLTDTTLKTISATPPMGWNSWNTFKQHPNETDIKQIADQMVASGLKAAGYEYVNLDDYWSLGRDSIGKIIINLQNYPHGMKAIADYIHSKGLKAGIYTNIGRKASYATLASTGYYQQDMDTFAAWGFDYVKVDVNFAPDRSETGLKKEFSAIAKAIANTGRPMVFSICNQGDGIYADWASGVGNLWRVGHDIDYISWTKPFQKTQWEGVIYEIDKSAAHPEIAGPGHWNDADMMLVGVTHGNKLTPLTDIEAKSHFSMWCMLASPLIMGNDIRDISKETLDILTNKEAIAIDQDADGVQGTMVDEQVRGLQVWLKRLKSGKNDNKYAVALFNRSEMTNKIILDFNKLGLKGKYQIRDVWTHKNIGKFSENFSNEVPAHGVNLLIITSNQ